MFWVELILFLACIVIGARIGGIGLEQIAGSGLMVFVFGVSASASFASRYSAWDDHCSHHCSFRNASSWWS